MAEQQPSASPSASSWLSSVSSNVAAALTVMAILAVGAVLLAQFGKIVRLLSGPVTYSTVTTVSVNQKIEPRDTWEHEFDLPERGGFEGKPKAVYIADMGRYDAAWGGGYPELVFTVARVTDNKARLFVYNPDPEEQDVTATVTIVVVD